MVNDAKRNHQIKLFQVELRPCGILWKRHEIARAIYLMWKPRTKRATFQQYIYLMIQKRMYSFYTKIRFLRENRIICVWQFVWYDYKRIIHSINETGSCETIRVALKAIIVPPYMTGYRDILSLL